MRLMVRLAVLAALLVGVLVVPAGSHAATPPVLRVAGRQFVDPSGGTVLLRGVNVAGNSKVPPFVPFTDLSRLDPLPGWGINTIRLVFSWEAYEPVPGQYRADYLAAMRAIADAAWQRGMYVVVDIHQDGFARNLAGGCGDGFPLWAIARGATPDEPDNGPGCADWAERMTLDPDVHASFRDFYADTAGVRGRYLTMLRRVAARFATVPGVVGYDPLNEPWGWDHELTALYRHVAVELRSAHPTAIMFIEGHVSTNGGNQSGLAKPDFGNLAYAPHFYDGPALRANAWSGSTYPTDRGYANMAAKAAQWGVPLFVGEFGIGATATNGAAYVALQYRRLDDHLASGAQWNYTPGWTPATKDGWNGEDLSIVDDAGRLRPTFRPRPYPVRTAGTPTRLTVTRDAVEFHWNHAAGRGHTVLFLPVHTWFGTGEVMVDTTGEDLRCHFDTRQSRLICQTGGSGPMAVRVTRSRSS